VRPTWPQDYVIRMSSGSTTGENTTGVSGSRWTTWMAPTWPINRNFDHVTGLGPTGHGSVTGAIPLPGESVLSWVPD
jgi:hypothetical protein